MPIYCMGLCLLKYRAMSDLIFNAQTPKGNSKLIWSAYSLAPNPLLWASSWPLNLHLVCPVQRFLKIPQRWKGTSPTWWAITCCAWQREYVEVANERLAYPFARLSVGEKRRGGWKRGGDSSSLGRPDWSFPLCSCHTWLVTLSDLPVLSCKAQKSPLDLKWTLDWKEGLAEAEPLAYVLLCLFSAQGPEWKVPIKIRCAKEAGKLSEDLLHLWIVTFEILRGWRSNLAVPMLAFPAIMSRGTRRNAILWVTWALMVFYLQLFVLNVM